MQCSAGGVQLTPQGNQYIGNFPTGVTTISCTVTDACGLSSQCQFTATVQGGRFDVLVSNTIFYRVYDTDCQFDTFISFLAKV